MMYSLTMSLNMTEIAVGKHKIMGDGRRETTVKEILGRKAPGVVFHVSPR